MNKEEEGQHKTRIFTMENECVQQKVVLLVSGLVYLKLSLSDTPETHCTYGRVA